MSSQPPVFLLMSRCLIQSCPEGIYVPSVGRVTTVDDSADSFREVAVHLKRTFTLRNNEKKKKSFRFQIDNFTLKMSSSSHY